ncbi:hypothetical protein G9A89_017111 [Geosiphon pyriformis]|nr:hypothetical protein G9A89_017111 [Geosiphon pyriformis]
MARRERAKLILIRDIDRIVAWRGPARFFVSQGCLLSHKPSVEAQGTGDLLGCLMFKAARRPGGVKPESTKTLIQYNNPLTATVAGNNSSIMVSGLNEKIQFLVGDNDVSSIVKPESTKTLIQYNNPLTATVAGNNSSIMVKKSTDSSTKAEAVDQDESEKSSSGQQSKKCKIRVVSFSTTCRKMVKVKTPGREAFRSAPITNYFQRIPNPNKNKSLNGNSQAPTPVTQTPVHSNCNTPTKTTQRRVDFEEIGQSSHNLPKPDITGLYSKSKERRLETPSATAISEDEDEVKNVPDIIIDDDDDELLLNTTFDFSTSNFTKKLERIASEEVSLRRSSRARKAVTLENYVPTVDAVPLKDRPMQDYINGGAKSYQFSLASLLREKKSRDKTGYDIQYLERTLNDGKSLDELDDQYAEYDRQELSEQVLPEEKSEQLLKIFKEDDQMDSDQQLNFFEVSPKIILPLPILSGLGDRIFSLLVNACSDKPDIQDILCNGWIVHQYEMGWSIPNEVIIWLLDIVSFAQEAIIAEAAFDNLKKLASIKLRWTNKSLKGNHDIEVGFFRIISIFSAFGASSQFLGYRSNLEEKTTRILPSETSSDNFPYTFNIQLIVRLLGHLAECRCLVFHNNDEIRLAINVLLRLSLDSRLWKLFYDVETIVGSLLNQISEEDWGAQAAEKYCEEYWLTGFYLTNLRCHGIWLRHLDITKPIHLGPLLDLFQESCSSFKIHKDTNYNTLSDLVSCLSFAIDDPQQMRTEKNTVEEIIKKLKHTHGKIVDMRAAFLDRTKVNYLLYFIDYEKSSTLLLSIKFFQAKDLIQRLLLRLYYVINYRHSGQRQASILYYSPKKSQRTLDLYTIASTGQGHNAES